MKKYIVIKVDVKAKPQKKLSLITGKKYAYKLIDKLAKEK